MSSAAGGRRITPVILCGGAGTRLWPLSRSARPKQMLALEGPRTMLRATADRVADRSLFEAPIVVAGAAQAEDVRAQLGGPAAPGRLILEPEARNTAPAIALAALESGGEDLLLVMPSDHLIGDPGAFLAAVQAAAPLARQGWLVTFGIRPDRAETGYGYIRRGEEIRPGMFRAERFVEKPDAATAEALVADGMHHWNAGIFLFRADSFLDLLAQHAPGIEEAAREAMERAAREGPDVRPEPEAFARALARSVDHAVMEHADRIALVPVDMRWTDLGSWQALWEAGARDKAGNVVTGEVLALDARDCLIRSEGPLVVAIGVSDLAIVAAGDVVLIVPREDSQRVQEAVAALRERSDARL